MKQIVFYLFLFILLFNGKTFSQPVFPPDGEIFRDDILPKVEILIHPDSLALIYEFPESNHEYPAIFIFDNGATPDTVENVGFRLRGNTSRSAKKKSFKVSFNTFISGRKYQCLEKMNLNGEHNDPSVIRSKLCWELFRKFDVPAPSSNHIKFYINGNFYGVYINVEHIDEEFVNSRFGNQDGNLYKCLWPADLNYLGSNPELYKFGNDDRRAYDLKTNRSEDDYSDLAFFIDVLNNTPLDELPCALEKIFNIYDYLKIIAVDILTADWDGYIFNKNNFYLYHNTETGKFEYIPYDLDNTFGIDWFGISWIDRNIYEWSPGSTEEYRPLYDRIILIQKYRDQLSYYFSLLIGLMNPDDYFPEIDTKREMIYPWISVDPFYPLDYGFSVSDFLNSYNQELGGHVVYGLKPFISGRLLSANAQLQLNNIQPVVKYISSNRPGLFDEIFITAFVEDENSEPVVELVYTINNGAVSDCPMFDDGRHNDGESDDNIYGCILEPFLQSGKLNFQVSADDSSGLSTLSPCEAVELLIMESTFPKLYINEFLSANNSVNADEYGEYDDWIEIYNGDTDSVWLGDKYLTDKLSNPDKWQFPDMTIEPGEFLLIWADNNPEQGELHTNFKLSKNGEQIGIFDSGNTGFAVIDTLSYGPQNEDISYGRKPDGADYWLFYLFPTPGISNSLSLIENNNFSDVSVQVYPNPFFNDLDICLSLKKRGEIKVEILSLTGQRIRTIIDANANPGIFHLKWNGEDSFNRKVKTGLYFCRIFFDEKPVKTEKISFMNF